jgi:hypothetical protein
MVVFLSQVNQWVGLMTISKSLGASALLFDECSKETGAPVPLIVKVISWLNGKEEHQQDETRSRPEEISKIDRYFSETWDGTGRRLSSTEIADKCGVRQNQGNVARISRLQNSLLRKTGD